MSDTRDLAARLETAADYLATDNYGDIVDDLRIAAVHFRSLRHVAALAVSAAVKHTGGRHAVRDSRNQTAKFLKLDRDAVGRLHNAAKIARRTLDAGACGMCQDRADSGVDLIGQPGNCAECGRIWAHTARYSHKQTKREEREP